MGLPNPMRLAPQRIRFPGLPVLQTPDRSLLRDQPHFRLEDFITVKTSPGSYHSRVASLARFLAKNMPDLEEFGLLIYHQNHLLSAAPILASLRKLKVLLIDKCESVQSWYTCSATDTMDAISGLSELSSLYYFSSRNSREYYEDDYSAARVHPSAHVLTNGQNFFEVMLRKVRVLHAPGMTFPFGMNFDNIQELSIMHEEQPCVTRNQFPALRKLIAPASFLDYPLMGYGCPAFVNVEVLRLYGREIYLDNKTMRALNDMPKLTELHCRAVELVPETDNQPVTNQSIVRLYSKNHILYMDMDNLGMFMPRHRGRQQPANPDPTVEELDDYARQCKLSFVGLKRFENERPAHVVDF